VRLDVGTDESAEPWVSIGRAGEGRLRFGPPIEIEPGDVRLPFRIESPGLSVESAAWLMDVFDGGAEHLIGYFDEIAAAWRGWSGTKEWRDERGTLTLTATHDGVGTVTIRAAASRAPYEVPDWWRVEAIIHLDPGVVDALAAALAHLVGVRPGASDIPQR
jgi:hypothetical protein